jgi:dihydroorotate dehydrogenase electron transfer subunit
MQIDAKIISNVKIGDNIFHMKLDCGRPLRAKPGQFINILVSDSYRPLLRRPFSIFDADKKSAEIVYKVIGDGTRLLSEKKIGDILNFLGPLGGSYLNSELGTRNSELVLIGGGTGIASLHFLAKELRKKKVKFSIFQGAKTRSEIILADEFKKYGCIFATDDGSFGSKGFVTGLIEDKLKNLSQVSGLRSRGGTKPKTRNPQPATTIFACGPKPMFKSLQELAWKRPDVSVLASFEEYMGCGIGACLSCVVEVKVGDYSEYRRVCKDGTIFNLKDVIF